MFLRKLNKVKRGSESVSFSLFNDISSFVDYLTTKPSVKNRSGII